MLSDVSRTESYRRAIQGPFGADGGSVVAGRRVLDLGCGTGILSLFAADAGAAAVVALDASTVIDDAAAIVRGAGKGDAIACVLGRAEDVPLHRVVTGAEAGVGVGGGGGAGASGGGGNPTGGAGFALLTGALGPDGGPSKVFDVIVSEWMGYALLYESMLASVLIARDRHLKPGGLLLPSSASIFLGAVSDTGLWAEKVTWWKNVYGYDMSVMAKHAWPEPLVETLQPSSLCSEPPHATLAVLRMAHMSQEEQDLRGVPFSLTVQPAREGFELDKEGKILVHGLAVWFNVGWEEDRYWPAGSSGAPPPPPPPASAKLEVTGDDLPPELEEVEGRGGGGGAAAAASAPPLCTSPHSTPTHWHQTTLLLREPQRVKPGGVLRGSMSMVRDGTNPREYRFAVDFECGASQRWHMK